MEERNKVKLKILGKNYMKNGAGMGRSFKLKALAKEGYENIEYPKEGYKNPR